MSVVLSDCPEPAKDTDIVRAAGDVPRTYSLIPVDVSLYSLGVSPVSDLKIELKVVFELNPES
jgi:hypothetical protein